MEICEEIDYSRTFPHSHFVLRVLLIHRFLTSSIHMLERSTSELIKLVCKNNKFLTSFKLDKTDPVRHAVLLTVLLII